MSRFLSTQLERLSPYTPGEQPKIQNLTKLNTNELPYPPAPEVIQAAVVSAKGLNLYNDPTSSKVTRPLAGRFGVPEAQVYVGNGSDEVLAFAFQAFCENGAAFADLTYGFYPVYAALYGVDAKIVPLRKDFHLAPEDYSGLDSTIFIANPNAPTGLALARQEIEGILQVNPNSLVVVDEAYVDFGAETSVPLVAAYDNLLVVGTFSKSTGLAGARLGYAVGQEALIADLNRIKYSFNPYNVNSMTQAVAAAALAQRVYYEDCRAKVCATRARVTDALRKLGFNCPDSMANFVFPRHPKVSGEILYKALRRRGILVRWFDVPRIREHLRITIGTDGEMDTLLAALAEILREEVT